MVTKSWNSQLQYNKPEVCNVTINENEKGHSLEHVDFYKRKHLQQLEVVEDLLPIVQSLSVSQLLWPLNFIGPSSAPLASNSWANFLPLQAWTCLFSTISIGILTFAMACLHTFGLPTFTPFAYICRINSNMVELRVWIDLSFSL